MKVSRTRVLQGLAVVAVLIVAFVLPYQLDSFKISVVTLAMTFALLAMGVNLMAGQAGLVSLGHAGVMAASGYGVAVLHTRTSVPTVVQIVAAMGIAVVVALLFGLMSMRTSGIYFFMATVAQGLMIWGLTMRFTSLTNGETGIRGVDRPAFIDKDWKLYYAVAVVLLLAVVAFWVMMRSPVGLVLRALKGSPSRLSMLGYNVALYKIYAFMLSGLFAGAAGVCFVYYNRFISPEASSFLTSGKALLMVILGGTGTLLGPLIGALLITGVENVVGTFTPRWPTVLGLLYVFVVLFARDGIIGTAARLRRIRRPDAHTRGAGNAAHPSADARNGDRRVP